MHKFLGRHCFLDFEFNRTTSPKVNLVSCVVYDRKSAQRFWLHNSPPEQKRLSKHLLNYKTIIGYACVAEARSFIALDLEPLDFGWIDEFLEYRMLTNHNDKLNWGKQYVDGKIKFIKKPKPKWERTEADDEQGFKHTHSLIEATYKLTAELRDSKEKDRVRQLIISDPEKFTAQEKEDILKYNEDDVMHLAKMFDRIYQEYCSLEKEQYHGETYFKEALWRGRYSAHTAHMETLGYPINFEATKNFSSQVQNILMECQRDINEQFPKTFRWIKNASRFQWDQNKTRAWLDEMFDDGQWKQTDGGKSGNRKKALSLEAFEKHFQFKHDYPRNNFGAQIVRYLKLKQSLYGFNDSGGKRKNFWDSVGPDKRVRPYLNIYGAQSSRSQPAASGFMFLKPAWMRALVAPKAGHFIAGIDYGQQEFFLSALESGDKNMIAAYLSGDPYLYGAKLAGVIPQNGTKDSHSKERDVFKNTYLGILYGMSKWGLAIKLTNDTGRKYDEDDAQEQISIFEDSFPDYIEWKKNLLMEYSDGEIIRLPDGWRMFADNENVRSVANVPIQGRGACIMRKAVDLAQKQQCRTIFTLHDAIYIEDKIENFHKVELLKNSMRDAFAYFYKDTRFAFTSRQIKLDPKAWSPSFKNGSMMSGKLEVPIFSKHIDKRAIAEYNKFKIYFEKPDWESL